MRVLFLALGATRRHEVIVESGRVAGAGGRAAVLVERATAWRNERFAPGVEVVEFAALRRRHPPWRIAELLLFRGPSLLFRAAGRGALHGWSRRTAKAYERRIAARVHRRLFLPVYERIWGGVQQSLIERHVMRGAAYDVLVVGDPLSMPLAARLIAGDAAGRQARPAVRFRSGGAELATAADAPPENR